MQSGVKALGKINPQSGVVTELPTVLNFDNYVMNSGGAIDPVNLFYYFQTLDTTSQIKMVGLSLLDGSVVSESYISSNGNYFIMYRIQNDCYEANPSRLNPLSSLKENKTIKITLQPNPADDEVYLYSTIEIDYIELFTYDGIKILEFEPMTMSVKLPIADLTSGVYWIRSRSKNGQETLRFVKN